MRGLIAAVLIAFGLAGVARSQGADPEWQRSFNAGIEALTQGRHDEGIAAFKRCLEIRPDEWTPTYNVACGYSLKNEVDTALEWFEKAVELGANDLDHWKQDKDLDNIREDPRYKALVTRLETTMKLGEEYAKEPALYLPKVLEGKDKQEELPVLVVMHDFGTTKNDVVSGRWRAVADALGYALIAPSGKHLAGIEKPEEGMKWWDNPGNYTRRPWVYERPVDEAISFFKKSHKLDRKRVLLVGEGQAGVLAFNIAVTYPGLYKGVLLVDGFFQPQLSGPKGANAGKMGLKARIVVDEARTELFGPMDKAQVEENLGKTMAGWQIEGGFFTYAKNPEQPDAETALLVEHLRALMPAPAPAAEPVEAGASDEQAD